MYIDYTETRNLVGSGVSELDFKAEPSRRKVNTVSAESVSDSGVNREVQLSRYDIEWSVKTVPLPDSNNDRWLEFEESVLAGETFTCDIHGTKAAPDNAVTMSMKKNSFVATRLSPAWWSYSFTVIDRS